MSISLSSNRRILCSVLGEPSTFGVGKRVALHSRPFTQQTAMDAKPIGFISTQAFAQVFGVSAAEMGRLRDEMYRQEVPRNRYGIDIDAAFRCLHTIRKGA